MLQGAASSASSGTIALQDGQRTRAMASGPSVPLALQNTSQGEAILREQIAEMTARENHLWAVGAINQFHAARAERERLQEELAAMSDQDIARYRRQLRRLEEEAEELEAQGDRRRADAVWDHAQQVRDGLRTMMDRWRNVT